MFDFLMIFNSNRNHCNFASPSSFLTFQASRILLDFLRSRLKNRWEESRKKMQEVFRWKVAGRINCWMKPKTKKALTAKKTFKTGICFWNLMSWTSQMTKMQRITFSMYAKLLTINSMRNYVSLIKICSEFTRKWSTAKECIWKSKK